MSFVKVYIHCVFVVKDRLPLLYSFNTRQVVWRHILENAEDKNINMLMVNGYNDHCHCLIALKSTEKLSEVLQLIKGESSFWINKEKICEERFQWQREYYASSVSESDLPKVMQYIKDQEKHHKSKELEHELSVLFKS